jgi:peptidoglycan/LPS O-acetylase OafA/YrhL
MVVIGYHFLPDGLDGGYVGVDVFFVISGFLITGLLVREHRRTGAISLPAFWARRARRLIPALVLVVTTCAATAYFIGGDLLVRIGGQVLGAATFSSNWLYIAQGASYFEATSPELLRNLWSLAVEEQFYLVWPAMILVVLLIGRRAWRVSAVLVLAIASAASMAALAIPGSDATRVYYGTDTHSFGLALGAALALLVEARFIAPAPNSRITAAVFPFAGAVAIGGIVVVTLTMPADDPLVTRGGLALVAALTALAIAGATTSGSWLSRGLDMPPLRWIGQRSYGLYLWHWPTLLLVSAILPMDSPSWLTPAVALVVTVAASALSYRYVEVPIRVLGFRGALASISVNRAIPRLALQAGVLTLLGSLVLTGGAIASDPGASEAQIAIGHGAQAVSNAAGPSSHNESGTTPPLPGGDQIYAVGDSVMLAAAPWLQEQFPGIAIDAAVSRSMEAGPPIVSALSASGALRPILIIGLGTNGSIDRADLDAIIEAVPSDTLIVVVNAQAPKPWIPGVNATLAEFARQERDVELANWHDAIAPRVNELARDKVHPGGPITGGIYIGAIRDALQRLAELPPVLKSNECRLRNCPV